MPGFSFFNFLFIENDPAKIKSMLDKILARNEFAGIRPFNDYSFLEKVFSTIGKWKIVRFLGKLLFSFLDGLSSILNGHVFSYFYYIILFAFLGALLIFIVFSIKNRIELNISVIRKEENASNSPDPSVHEHLAGESASNGDFSAAIRHLYISLLLILNIKGILSFSLSRTNRETAKILNSLDSKIFKENFSLMTSFFEEKIYALNPCSPDEYGIFKEAYESCKKGAGSVG